MIEGIRNYVIIAGVRGLWVGALGTLLGKSSLFEITSSRHRFPLRLRMPSTDVPTYKKIFIDKEYEFVTERSPAVIVDAGANIGLASIYFANKYPQAKIISIEPEQTNFDLLKANIAPYPKILPIQAALWNCTKDVELIDPGLGKWGFVTASQYTEAGEIGSKCHRITALTVNRLMEDFGLDRIDILKIDIEGAELEVFQDTSQWLNRVDAIVIELHERLKPGCNRSFYCGSSGFEKEWMQGENICLSRKRCIKRTPTLRQDT